VRPLYARIAQKITVNYNVTNGITLRLIHKKLKYKKDAEAMLQHLYIKLFY